MPTRFPGVAPYVEDQGYWPDFHSRTITYSADAISERLPDQYLVRIEERIHLVERDPELIKPIRPDLLVERSLWTSKEPGGAIVLEVEPITIPVSSLDEVRESYLEILHRPDRSVVTVMELLSPDNKVGAGSGQYLAKRDALLRSPVHLVELDFRIGGRRLPMERPLPTGHVFALVARGNRRPDCGVYGWSIRRGLSAIRLPLMAPDPDLRLDLPAIYAMAFERGRYSRSIDYAAPLTLPLTAEDRAWAEDRARAAR